jgi:hypothetical protein
MAAAAVLRGGCRISGCCDVQLSCSVAAGGGVQFSGGRSGEGEGGQSSGMR